MLEIVIEGLGFRPQWSPSFESLNWPIPHPDGRAASSLSPNSQIDTGFDYLFILLEDTGGVQVSAPAVRPWGREPDAPMVISPGHLLELVHGTLRLTGHLAITYTGYSGSWRAGLLATKLRGLRASQAHSAHQLESCPPFATDGYVEVTETSTREMTDETPAVVGRLVKRLLRALSVESRFLPYNHPTDFYPRSR